MNTEVTLAELKERTEDHEETVVGCCGGFCTDGGGAQPPHHHWAVPWLRPLIFSKSVRRPDVTIDTGRA